MQTTLDVLLSVHFILSNPDNWCAGSYSYNEKWQVTSPWANETIKWSFLGALQAVAYPAALGRTGDTSYVAYSQSLNAMLRYMNGKGGIFSDAYPYLEGMEALEKAINYELMKR